MGELSESYFQDLGEEGRLGRLPEELEEGPKDRVARVLRLTRQSLFVSMTALSKQ